MTCRAVALAVFRFHDELEAFLAPGRRGCAFEYTCARAATIKHALESLGVPHTEVGRVIVNGQAGTLSRIVREADAIEVYPHRPAGAAGDERHVFIADAHLGGLARLLRMLGFDTLYRNSFSDEEIRRLAEEERRTVLTRDRELLKCREALRGAFVHARKPERQLQEVAIRYGLAWQARPFTLCLDCNLALQAADDASIAARVPARIAAQYSVFMRCPGCDRILWQGSHWRRMREMLGTLVEIPENSF